MNRFAKVAAFLTLLCGLGLCLNSYAPVNAQAPSSLEAFFERVLQNPSTLPTAQELYKVTTQIGNARPEDINLALPGVFAALANQDEKVKAYACAALFATAGRPDGAKLLRSRINVIGQDLLTSPFENIRGGEIIILGNLKPVPPPEVIPIFLNLLKRTDPEAQAQGSGIIFELVRIAAENPEVCDAIREFLSRPLETKSRIDVLHALGNPNVKDSQLVATVMAYLDDPDQAIRITTVRTLIRLGQPALQRAEPVLERLANDPNEPAQVRDAAMEALQRLRPTKH